MLSGSSIFTNDVGEESVDSLYAENLFMTWQSNGVPPYEFSGWGVDDRCIRHARLFKLFVRSDATCFNPGIPGDYKLLISQWRRLAPFTHVPTSFHKGVTSVFDQLFLCLVSILFEVHNL